MEHVSTIGSVSAAGFPFTCRTTVLLGVCNYYRYVLTCAAVGKATNVELVAFSLRFDREIRIVSIN